MTILSFQPVWEYQDWPDEWERQDGSERDQFPEVSSGLVDNCYSVMQHMWQPAVSLPALALLDLVNWMISTFKLNCKSSLGATQNEKVLNNTEI